MAPDRGGLSEATTTVLRPGKGRDVDASEREYSLKIESKIKDFRKRKLTISRAKIKADLFGNEIH